MQVIFTYDGQALLIGAGFSIGFGICTLIALSWCAPAELPFIVVMLLISLGAAFGGTMGATLVQGERWILAKG